LATARYHEWLRQHSPCSQTQPEPANTIRAAREAIEL
jgi:hypothetical protein